MSDMDYRESKLSFKTPANARIVAEVDGDKSVVSVDELNSDGPFSVTLSVARKASLDGKSEIHDIDSPKVPNW